MYHDRACTPIIATWPQAQHYFDDSCLHFAPFSRSIQGSKVTNFTYNGSTFIFDAADEAASRRSCRLLRFSKARRFTATARPPSTSEVGVMRELPQCQRQISLRCQQTPAQPPLFAEEDERAMTRHDEERAVTKIAAASKYFIALD